MCCIGGVDVVDVVVVVCAVVHSPLCVVVIGVV